MPPTAAVGQPARSVCLQSPGAHAALLRLSNVAVVRALRAAGPDVTTAADLVGGADDTVVAGLAVSEARILLTEDKDFGQLAYATGHVQSGVILIRFPAGARRTVGAAVAHAVNRFGVRLVGSFVVVEPGRVRLGRPPRA